MEDLDQGSSLDIFGVKPIGDSIKSITNGTIKATSAFLSRICLPVAEEFGLLLKDKVRNWRKLNLIKIVKTSEDLHLKKTIPKDYAAHPKLVSSIIEHGSWEDDIEVQKMWAGLLTSSCSKSGKDDSNIIFISKLNTMTTLQAKLIVFICAKAAIHKDSQGLIWAERFYMNEEKIKEVTMCKDIHRIDRELDSLRQMDLIRGGIEPGANDRKVKISPSPLGLHLFARCNGEIHSVVSFFGLNNVEPVDPGPYS